MNMGKYNIRTLSEKESIVKYYQKHGWRATYEKYNIARATLEHWKKRLRTSKASDPHPLARRYHVGAEIVALVKKVYKENPHLSLSQIQEKVAKKQSISKTTIWHIIQGHRK